MRDARLVKRALGVVVVACLGFLLEPSWKPLVAQTDTADAALRDRVLQLVERLDDPKPEARDDAQARLIKLGGKILPLLPDPAGVTSKERKERLEKIRAALQEAGAETKTGPSKVTIQAKGIRLSEAIQQLQKQTGNAITDLREQLGAEVTNPAFDLDLRDVPFHEALDKVARLAEVSINAFTGDGSIGITAGMPAKDPLIQYVGPFRVAFKQLTEMRDLQAGTATANAQLEVGWEPRLRPMLLTLKTEDLAIKDDKGRDDQAPGDAGIERGRAPAREPGRRDRPQPRGARPLGHQAGVVQVQGRGHPSRRASRRSASPAWPRRTWRRSKGP